MKKTIYLTSLLTLTACMFGGGDGAPQPRNSGFNLGGNMTDKIACDKDTKQCFQIIMVDGQPQLGAAAKLNTKMYSRESTAKGRLPANLDNYDVYEANNIDMKISVSPGKISKQTFVIDDESGDVIGVKWTEGGIEEFVPSVVYSENGMRRIKNNKFSLDSEDSSGTVEYVNKADLKYANFGVMKVRNFTWTNHNIDDVNMDIAFAGGWQAAEQIPGADDGIKGVITYKGKAQGMVEYAGTAVDGKQAYLNVSDTNATLKLDTTSGITEKFTANFKNTDKPNQKWHTLNVTKTSDGIDFAFSGDTKTDKRFDMNGVSQTEGDMQVGYYGEEKDVPLETSGLIMYQEKINSGKEQIENNNKTMTVGFGMKVQ